MNWGDVVLTGHDSSGISGEDLEPSVLLTVLQNEAMDVTQITRAIP